MAFEKRLCHKVEKWGTYLRWVCCHQKVSLIEWDSTTVLAETPGGPGGYVVGPPPQALATDRAASKIPS